MEWYTLTVPSRNPADPSLPARCTMTAMNPADHLDELGQRTLRKVRGRLMPLIVLLYFIAYLDRNNVGFAKLTMSEDIGLSAAAYGLGAGTPVEGLPSLVMR